MKSLGRDHCGLSLLLCAALCEQDRDFHGVGNDKVSKDESPSEY